MSLNSFGHLFRVTTWGESHGPALGCVIDGCPPGVGIDAADIQKWLDLRKPGTSKYVTQRREADEVRILSGVFEGQSTGTPISLMIENTDQRSKDYGDIKDKFRPGHADYAYYMKYGIRDYRGGGRSSARETAARVAAGGVARAALAMLMPKLRIRGAMVQMGERCIDRATWDWEEVSRNPFWTPDPAAAADWADYLDSLRKSGDSVGAVIELVAEGVPAGLGAPVYGKLDSDLAAAMMTINAVKGVEIGDGFAAAALTGSANADEMRIEDVVEWTTPWAKITEKGVYGAPTPRKSGDDKRPYFDMPEICDIIVNDPDTGSVVNGDNETRNNVTLHLPRNLLESRGISHEGLKVVARLPRFETNHAGGVLGGISTGQNIVVRFAVKPTSSILTSRATIDRFGHDTEIVTKGRHDPCVGIRAVPVGEAMLACVLLDHVLLHRGQIGENRSVIGGRDA